MRVDLVTVPYRYDRRGEGIGAGPNALLDAGLARELASAGVEVGGHFEAWLNPDLRVEGRTAINIGILGAETAALVAASRRAGAGPLILAGDDTASIGVVSGLQQTDGAGARLGIVWLDAHGDFNTPDTSYSGILAGMPVAILAGLAGPLWREAAGLAAPIATERIILAGTRDLDEKEQALLQATEVRVVQAGGMRSGNAFETEVERLSKRCDLLYLHVDLDVLDPRFVPSASTPSPNGLTTVELIAAMTVVFKTGQTAAASMSSVNPGAGYRGQRSVASAMTCLVGALPTWQTSPMCRELTQ